jgi:hypothetical protein
MPYTTACYRCLTPVTTTAIMKDAVYCKSCVSRWNYFHNFEGWLVGGNIQPVEKLTGKLVH